MVSCSMGSNCETAKLKFILLEIAQLLPVNCLQKNALDDLVASNAFSLRPGAEE